MNNSHKKCYYMQSLNGQIRKIEAESDEEALRKAHFIDPNALVGTKLQHVFSKQDKSDIRKATKNLIDVFKD